jgi:hypothetical protein
MASNDLASRKGRMAERNAGTGPRVGIGSLHHESERCRLTAAITYRNGASIQALADILNSVGLMPVAFLKARAKWAESLNPQAKPIEVSEAVPSSSIRLA